MHQSESQSVLRSHSKELCSLVVQIETLAGEVMRGRSALARELPLKLDCLSRQLESHAVFCANFDSYRSSVSEELSHFLITTLTELSSAPVKRELAETALCLAEIVRTYLQLEAAEILKSHLGAQCAGDLGCP